MSEELTCEVEDLSLETRRLLLRPPILADAPAIAAHLADAEVSRMLARVPHPYTLADAEAFIADETDEDRVFAVTRKRGGELVGLVGLKDIGENRADLGYWIGRRFWGNGYATEAAQHMIDFGFERLGLKRIDASCRVVNGASRRVISKCGFPFCGPGMIDTLSSGRVASEHYTMDRRCWEAIRAWGRR